MEPYEYYSTLMGEKVISLKKLAKYYLKRLPEVLLVIYGFSLSLAFGQSDTDRMRIISIIFNIQMFILLFALPMFVAIFDYVCIWLKEKCLEDI